MVRTQARVTRAGVTGADVIIPLSTLFLIDVVFLVPCFVLVEIRPALPRYSAARRLTVAEIFIPDRGNHTADMSFLFVVARHRCLLKSCPGTTVTGTTQSFLATNGPKQQG